MSDGDGGAKERPADEEPVPDSEPAPDAEPPDPTASDVETHPGAEPASSRARRDLRIPAALYFAGFAVVLFSFAALALGGLSLLGRGIDASPTGFFWTSIVLSVVALGLALAALFAPRRR